jgi:hypothetical protein
MRWKNLGRGRGIITTAEKQGAMHMYCSTEQYCFENLGGDTHEAQLKLCMMKEYSSPRMHFLHTLMINQRILLGRAR